MAEQIYLEIEENDNCDYMPMQIYEAMADPVPVIQLRLFESDKPHGLYAVTGWSSEGNGSSTPAMYLPVADSGQAVVHLVRGDDWGIRLKPAGSKEDWDINNPDQWGEPFLILTDKADVITEI